MMAEIPKWHSDIVRDTLSWIHTHPDLSMEFQRDAEKHLDALVAERDEAQRKAASYLAQLSDMDLLRAAAEARVTALEHAADYAIHELGVPQDELTPAPVANAYRVLVAALAAPTKEGT